MVPIFTAPRIPVDCSVLVPAMTAKSAAVATDCAKSLVTSTSVDQTLH